MKDDNGRRKLSQNRETLKHFKDGKNKKNIFLDEQRIIMV